MTLLVINQSVGQVDLLDIGLTLSSGASSDLESSYYTYEYKL